MEVCVYEYRERGGLSENNKLEVIVQLQRTHPSPQNPYDFMCCFTMQRQTDTVEFLAVCVIHGCGLLWVGSRHRLGWRDGWVEGRMDEGWMEEEEKTNFLY